MLIASPAASDILITEVFYDPIGADDTYEWVELYNTHAFAVDLTGYILAWGGTDYGYGSIVLNGTIGPQSTFVVGGPVANAQNGLPVYDQAEDFVVNPQNGGTASDAVALFLPGADVLTDTPLDAVIYDSPNTNGLIDETGAVGAMDVDDAPSDSSIERISLAGDWVIQPAPDPNNVEFGETFISWVEHRIDDQEISGVNLRGADGLAMDDLNGDGYPDVVSVHEFSDHVRIAFGTADPNTWDNHTLASGITLAGEVEDVDIGDVNGDGRLDVVVASEVGYLVYFEAPAVTKDMGSWTATVLTETLNRGSWIRVKLADLDADGQLEILGANKVGPGFGGVEPWTFSVFHLTGAATDPTAWSETVLGARPTPINIRPVDIDADGDLDVVGSSRTNREIVLFENTGGGTSWTERTIYNAGFPNTQGFMMEFADLNGDGLLDIVTGDSSGGDGGVYWLQQPLNPVGVWLLHVMGTIWPDDVDGLELVDVNGDGLLDLFVGGYARSGTGSDLDQCARLAWFERPLDTTQLWTRHEVSRRRIGMFDSFAAQDVNQDGHVDIIATRGNSGAFDGVIWLEKVVTSEPPAQIFTPAREDDSPEVPLPMPSSVGDGDTARAQGVTLHQNTPNPFNPLTVIRYEVPAGGSKVTLRVFDVRGQLVRTLVDQVESEGIKEVTWDGRGDRGSRVATGTYFFRVTAQGFETTRKMALLR